MIFCWLLSCIFVRSVRYRAGFMAYLISPCPKTKKIWKFHAFITKRTPHLHIYLTTEPVDGLYFRLVLVADALPSYVITLVPKIFYYYFCFRVFFFLYETDIYLIDVALLLSKAYARKTYSRNQSFSLILIKIFFTTVSGFA